jgi:SepF-like predicted cell division protein (DUF552 family)
MRFRILNGRTDAPDIETEDYVEVNVADSASVPMGKVGIKIEKLNDFADTERILKAVRTGNVIFIKIRGLKEKDLGELKRAVEKLKKSAVANNGDIAGIEQDWLVLTPEHAVLHRD